MKKIIIFLCIACTVITACKKSSTDNTSNASNCTTRNTCTVAFTNDYSSTLDIKVYDSVNTLKLTITGLASGATISKDSVPAGNVIVRWSGGTLSGTLSHFYNYTACQSYTEKYYTTLPSDARYKKNINAIDASDVLQNLMLLKPYSYEYDFLKFPALNAVQGKTNGFIAQDLEKIFPEVVIKNSEGYRSVNYVALMPVLTAAIQEQQLQINVLKNEIAVLSKKR